MSDGAQDIIVGSALQYGFFREAEVRQPTAEGYDGLLAATSSFYEGVLRTEFPSLVDFQASFAPQEFWPVKAESPVFVEFDANTFFPKDQPDLPKQAQIFAVLRGADYACKNSFIARCPDINQ